MSRQSNAFDDNFETVTGLDGKPMRILKDGGRIRISMRMRDAVVGTGSHGPRGQVVGDVCTINGSEGRLRNVKGDLVCVPLKSQDAKPQFTDGHTTDSLALQRPGWRIPAVNDRRAVTDTYRRVELGQTKAYRIGDKTQCPECFGSGEDEDGEACSACNGNGIMSERSSRTSKGFGSSNEGGHNTPDPASDAQTMIRDHRANMDRLYAERDAELSNAWRTK
jgi:hypothetical protein